LAKRPGELSLHYAPRTLMCPRKLANVINMLGEVLWPWLKEQVIAAQREKTAGEDRTHQRRTYQCRTC
jgi:hypothetical protein